MMAVTVVSAEEEHAVNSGTELTFASVGKNYTVSPWTENSLNSLSTGKLIYSTDSATYYISQGQTRVHTGNVGSGVNFLEVNLNWGDTSDSLTLSIYDPSGSYLGTYHDNSDGSVNGRIHLYIYPSGGYIAPGYWMFKVYGESVSGSQSYTLNLYTH